MATGGASNTAAEPPTSAGATPNESSGKGLWSEGIRLIGGLAAVFIGVVAVAGIAAGALIVGTQTAATIAGSTAGVIGSIVGAYFGVKVGTDQTKNALETAQKESAKKDQHAAKAQVYALNVPQGEAANVEAEAQAAAQAVGQA